MVDECPQAQVYLSIVSHKQMYYVYHGADLPTIEEFKDPEDYAWQIVTDSVKLSDKDIIKLGHTSYLVRSSYPSKLFTRCLTENSKYK